MTDRTHQEIWRPTRRALLAGGACAWGLSWARAARADQAKTVEILPLGTVPALEIKIVERALRSFYSVEVQTHAARALPPEAFYAPRRRYRAERLLSALERMADPASLRVLGLTQVDISTTKDKIVDWGILGLATLDGRVCVLSSYRCRRLAKDAEQTAERLGKTAVHELGHTFGLEHCPVLGCVMEDGKGSVLTSDREYDLCDLCRQKLDPSGLLRTPREPPPWRRPG